MINLKQHTANIEFIELVERIDSLFYNHADTENDKLRSDVNSLIFIKRQFEVNATNVHAAAFTLAIEVYHKLFKMEKKRLEKINQEYIESCHGELSF